MSRRYLDNGEYRTASQLNMIVKEFEEPNRGYAFAYKEYLELNNRKARTIARRLGDLRFILRVLPKDAKLATRKDIENLVLSSIICLNIFRMEGVLEVRYLIIYRNNNITKCVMATPYKRPTVSR